MNDDLAGKVADLDSYCRKPRSLGAIARHLRIDESDARDVIHGHRLHLSDKSALIQVWTARRDGSPGCASHYVISSVPEEILEWTIGRLRDGDTRLKTMRAIARVAVKVTDGRSVNGRVARLYARHIGRLVEDLEVLFEEVEQD